MNASKNYSKVYIIFDELQNAREERDVDFVYSKYLQKYFNASISHPFKCDGLLEKRLSDNKNLKLICEYKYDLDFNKKFDVALVLVQVIYYLKKFEVCGEAIPNVVFVGDKDECFCLQTKSLLKYLDENIDWSIAPSGAKTSNVELINKIINDKEINPFIFVIDEKFNMQCIFERIEDLAEDVQKFIHITEHNIQSIYEYFYNRVLTESSKKLDTKDLVALFIGVLTDKDNFYLHPRRKNVLVAQKLFKEFSIKSDAFKSFFSLFNDEYSVDEKRVFSSIADRLIEDADRRKSGDFWTPTKWVDYAQKQVNEVLGENWREEFVVWDNCSGSCNLTRDYMFKELYISTLFKSELMMGEKYNPEAVHFQFDFLNDYIPSMNEQVLFSEGCKLPEGLLNAFRENKKILFLMNPPYAAGAGGIGKNYKEGSSSTKTRESMVEEGFGKSAQNLYAQFLYRIEKLKREYNLTNLYIGVYSPTLFLTGPAFKDFRKNFLNDFEYIKGFTFQASHFADVKSNWGIGFSIWKSGKTMDKHNFIFDVCDVDKDDVLGEVKVLCKKDVYNIDNEQSLKEWSIEPVKKLKTFDVPNLSAGCSVKEGKTTRGKNFDGALGYLQIAANNINKNAQQVALFTSAFSNANGFGVNEDNFDRSCIAFAARKLISSNWINSKDEYLAPNTSASSYEEFKNDSIIFSLFHSSSNQSSLRNVEYNKKTWQIKNEFFWSSKKQIQDLAKENNNEFTYNDALTSNDERFTYKLLQSIKLSKEAQDVLDKANELLKLTFQYREQFNEDNPNLQVNNWDCGYYQLKNLWKSYAPAKFIEFKAAFKTLSDKMRPQVYELGMLKS